MFRFVPELGKDVLDIPELNSLRRKLENSKHDPKNYYHKKKALESIRAFLDWIISYCSSEIKGKSYSERLLVECVLRDAFKSDNQWKDYLLKCIYLSHDYAVYLKGKIDISNLKAFEHAITEFEIDIEWLVASFEVQYKKTTNKISLNSGRRKNLSPTDLYSAARTLFHIEEFKKIEELYLRDLKPVVMFQIRQLLEVYGRELIGYYSITDLNDNPVKKFTQICWDFIKEEVKNPNPRMAFKYDIHMIIAINTWSNSFVHTTFLYSSYIQHFVLNTIGIIFKHRPEISSYNDFKIDFENFIKQRTADIKIDWMDIKQIGSKIKSQ